MAPNTSLTCGNGRHPPMVFAVMIVLWIQSDDAASVNGRLGERNVEFVDDIKSRVEKMTVLGPPVSGSHEEII